MLALVAALLPFLVGASGFDLKDGILYDVRADPGSFPSTSYSVARYDVDDARWLSGFPVPGPGGWIDVSTDAIYVSTGGVVARLTLDGETVWSVPGSGSLELDAGLLFVGGETLRVLDAATGAEIDALAGGFYRVSVDAAGNRVFGVRSVVYPAGPVVSSEYSDSGVLSDARESTFVRGSGAVWALPSGEVVDSTGAVRDADDLEWVGNLRGVVEAVSPTSQGFVALHRDEVVHYAQDRSVLGRHPFGSFSSPYWLHAEGETVVVLGLSVRDGGPRVPLADFLPGDSGIPLDPLGLESLESSAVAFDGEDTLFFLSASHQSLFRWSIDAGSFLETIPLVGEGEYMALSEAERAVYVAYSWGLHRIDLDTLEQVPWADLRLEPCGLTLAGDLIVACEGGSFTTVPESLVVLGANGTLLDHLQLGFRIHQLGWNPVLREIYLHGWSGFSAMGLDPSGALGDLRASPESVYSDSSPILVSPTGEPFVRGTILDPVTLEATGSVIGTRAVWIDGGLVTLASSGRPSRIWTFDSLLEPTASVEVEGRGAGLFARDGEAVVVSTAVRSSTPLVHLFDVLDLDGDGVPTEVDLFPGDPLDWADRDGDGVGDNADVFPDDPLEAEDSDGDGVGDRYDAFRYDPLEWLDSDGDRVGDNADAFPFDPTESVDTDGDGTPDSRDPYPRGTPVIGVELNGFQKIRVNRLGKVEEPLEGHLGLLADGTFSWCRERGCLFGTWSSGGGGGRRHDLTFDPDALTALEGDLARAVLGSLDFVTLTLRPDKLRFQVKVDRTGERATIKLRGRHESEIAGGRSSRGVWKWALRSVPVETGP